MPSTSIIRRAILPCLAASLALASCKSKPEADVDVGRANVSGNDADWAAFKIPSPRNVAKSAPYFHDGSVATLEEAVKIMATGGIDNKNKTAILADRGLSDEEMKSLLAFLGPPDCGDKLASNLRSRDPVVRVGRL